MALLDIFKGRPNVEKLRESGDADGVLRALSYKDVVVRIQAAAALGHMRDPRATSALIDALKDSEVRAAAAQSLAELGEPAIEPLIAALTDADPALRVGAVEALVKWGDKVCDPIAQAKDPETKLRLAVERGVAGLKDERLRPALVAALSDAEVDVRLGAVKALSLLGGAGAVEPLVRTLGEDASVDVRKEALSRLATLWAGFFMSGVKEYIVAAMVDRTQTQGIRLIAAAFLGRLGAMDDLVAEGRKCNLDVLNVLVALGDQGVDKVAELLDEGRAAGNEELVCWTQAALSANGGARGRRALSERGLE